MLFSSVFGKQQLIERWLIAYHRNRLHPCTILQEHEGAGALQLALAFAQFLLCEQQNELPPSPLFGNDNPRDSETNKESCGTCLSCRQVSGLIHPDIHFFFPVVSNPKGKKQFSKDYLSEWREFIQHYPFGNIADWVQFSSDEPNKQPNISAKECAHFLDALHLHAYTGSRKIIVFWLPEYLGKEANRLLKAIEELPQNAYVFFITHDYAQLLPTFLSRCFHITVPLAKDEDVLAYLSNHFPKLTAEEQREIIQYATGNLNYAQRHASYDIDQQQILKNDIITMFKSISEDGPLKQIEWLNTMHAKGRAYVKQFFSMFQDLLHQRLGGSIEKHVNETNITNQALIKLLQSIHPDYLQPMSDLACQSSYAIRRNTNVKLELHHFLIQMYLLFQKQTIRQFF